jgi:glycosyltransferase involved in cell wall biosynthesis
VALAAALLVLVAHAIHLVVHYRRCAEGYVRLDPMRPARKPAVSVIIPARNEARGLAQTIESLLAQQGADIEALIVDDHSVDETAAIARRYAEKDPRVRVLSAPALPDGWCGKPHAQAHGAAHASHSVLLFADADVRFTPAAVASAVAALESGGVDLVTLLPAAELRSFWERAVQPVMAAVILHSVCFAKVNDPADSQSAGVGAFLLVRRSIYDRAGGHAAIRDRIVDDYALAHIVKRAGGRLRLADGRALISIRMYHTLGEIWRGWSKNLYEGLRMPVWVPVGRRDYYVLEDRPLAALGLLSSYLLATFVLPLIVPFWAIAASGNSFVIATAWGVCAAFVAGWGTLARRIGLGVGWGLALPAGAAVVMAIAFHSAWSARFGGGLAWRGRRYRVAP